LRRCDLTKGRSPSNDELMPSNRRIEAFSDAVFAIVVTIMVFEINIPDSVASGNAAAGLEQLGALLATYALSFIAIAILWGSHHYLIFTLPKADRATIWLNNHVLFWVTLIPVVAQFFGRHPMAPRAAAAWAFVIMMATFAFSLLRLHASKISHNELHRELHRRVFRKAWPATLVYAATIPLAFVSMPLVWICFLIIPAVFFLPVTSRPHMPEYILRSPPSHDPPKA
jgi:uncharacterized membrane protein